MTPGNVRNIILNLKQIDATAESGWSHDFLGIRCKKRAQRAPGSVSRSVIGERGSASDRGRKVGVGDRAENI
jgi:hypothetical protein